MTTALPKSADVIVVGGGNAAFCAALAAAEQGVSVLVLERAPEDEAGGNSRFTAALAQRIGTQNIATNAQATTIERTADGHVRVHYLRDGQRYGSVLAKAVVLTPPVYSLPSIQFIPPLSDAKQRGIKDQDHIRVYNDRGTIEIIAKVTARIMPGVITVPQGAWYAPDKDGVDKGSCTNTLTTWHPTPLAKGNGQHSNLVEIEKA